MKTFPILSLALAGMFAVEARCQSELEATLQGVDLATNTIRVLGLDIDCSTAAIHTLGGVPLTLAQCAGAPLPGAAGNGYIGGTVFVTSQLTPAGIIASDVVMTTPETVLIGNLTQNDAGGGVAGRAVSVLGVPVAAAIDARLDPFQALINGLELDMASVPLGSVVALEGYFGADGRFYAHVLEAEQGQALNPAAVAIQRAKCKGGVIDARGTFSRPNGTVQMLDQNDRAVASAPVLADGTWSIRARLPGCPIQVRVRHVETGAVSAPFAVTN